MVISMAMRAGQNGRKKFNNNLVRLLAEGTADASQHAKVRINAIFGTNRDRNTAGTCRYELTRFASDTEA